MVYIQACWQVSLTVAGMAKWLHRQGFSYKKPKGVLYKLDADKQQQFIEAYHALKDEFGQNKPILFIDAMHPSQPTRLSYGWIKSGKM